MCRPDRTAHIRADLARTAMYFATGLVIVLAAAVSAALVVQLADGSVRAWLLRALWITALLAVTMSLTGLALVLVRWWWYRHRRTDLDVAGAQATGELYTRLVYRRRRER